MTLPKETIDKIKADAEHYANVQIGGKDKISVPALLNQWEETFNDYEAGATEWAGRAEEQIQAALHKERNEIQAKITRIEVGYLKQIEALVNTLKWIQMHCPIEPIVDDAISAALAKYKEVSNG